MSNIWILLKAQLINFFPINEIRDSGNKKQSSMAIASFGIITLTLFCFVYNILTAKTLVQVGQQDLIPAYMVSVSSFSILFLTVHSSASDALETSGAFVVISPSPNTLLIPIGTIKTKMQTAVIVLAPSRL